MRRDLAMVSMIAAVTFVVLLCILHVVRADLAPGAHMISEYAVGRYRWLTAATFLALATSFIALAAALFPTTRGVRGNSAIVLLVAAGVGAAIGGLFPMDPVGTIPADFSTSGKMHNLGFVIGVPGTLLGVTLLSLFLWRQPEWQSAHTMLISTVAAVWITMIVFGASMATILRLGTAGPEPVIGWHNRALVLSWAAWLLLVARRLR